MKDKYLQIKVSEKQKSVIVALAEKAGATITDFCLSRILNVPLVAKPEEIIYITKKYRSKGRRNKLQEV
jgi:uncharacterized protein (DUF1778 family)